MIYKQCLFTLSFLLGKLSSVILLGVMLHLMVECHILMVCIRFKKKKPNILLLLQVLILFDLASGGKSLHRALLKVELF